MISVTFTVVPPVKVTGFAIQNRFAMGKTHENPSMSRRKCAVYAHFGCE